MSAKPTARAMLLVLTAYTAGALLHADRVPLWCLAIAVISVTWHVLYVFGRVHLPGMVLRMLIVASVSAATLASFRTFQGLGAGSALLLVMGAAKLLEVRQRRDALVVTFVSLVLLLAACLDRQSLGRLPLYLVAGWISCAAIAALGSATSVYPIRAAFRTSGMALLLGLPFAIACFLLVPRLPGPLWGLPNSEQAQTGLGDEMSPGSITELTISDAPAFRVRFQEAPPPSQARYWRGPVLHAFDGYTWRRLRGQVAPLQAIEPLDAATHYRVMLEPHGRNWLYGLDTVRSLTGQRNLITFDGQVIATLPVTSLLAYDAISNLHVRYPGPLSHVGRRLDTALPPNRNPRSLALARSMRADAADDRDYARRVLEMFRTGGFRYTLAPPLLDHDSVDDLLFNTRLGFCGHFASAYVTLMRAAGLPARVVTGYLGGEWNSMGEYYLIRQSDAHAWAEVWFEGEGWVRIDPTAVVAPGRMQSGLREYIPESGRATGRMLRYAPWMRDLAAAWDASGNWWQERVVRFNMASQLSLLQRFGLGGIDYRGMALLLLAAATAWGLCVALWAARGARRPHQDALGATWLRFLALLRRRGLQIEAHEPPRAVAQRAARSFPGAAPHVGAFTDQYLSLRYGAGPPATVAQIRFLRELLSRIARDTAAPRRQQTAATGRG